MSLVFDQVLVDITKLRDYCLSDLHHLGKHKARVFQSQLGWRASDAELLRQALLHAVETNLSAIEPRNADEHGARFRLDFELPGRHGPVTIRSSWIIRTNEIVLRFITCYVL